MRKWQMANQNRHFVHSEYRAIRPTYARANRKLIVSGQALRLINRPIRRERREPRMTDIMDGWVSDSLRNRAENPGSLWPLDLIRAPAQGCAAGPRRGDYPMLPPN